MKILLTEIDTDIIFSDEKTFIYIMEIFRKLRNLFGVVQFKTDKGEEQ